MKINTLTLKLRQAAAVLAVSLAFSFSFAPLALAAGNPNPPVTNKACNPQASFCSPFDPSDNPAYHAQNGDNGNPIINDYIKPAVSALSALAGIAIGGSVIFAGIQYATAGGDSSKVSAAKMRILKSIVVLVVYLFFYAFMRFFLPGAGL